MLEKLIDRKTEYAGLVTIGIFAHVRHPMYLGYILAYLGCIVGTMSLLTIITWFVYNLSLIRLANCEEQELEQRFGKEYLNIKESAEMDSEVTIARIDVHTVSLV